MIIRHWARVVGVAVLASGCALAPGGVAHASPGPVNGRIAFSTGFDELEPGPVSNIFTINPDGTGRRQLTHVPQGTHALHPDYSPDGRRILFTNDTTGDWQIWVMWADGTHQRRLLRDPGSDDLDPSWSPDGRRIVFSRCAKPFGFQAYCDVDVIRADGSHRRRLVRGNWEHRNPRYAPGGRRIAFESTKGGLQSAIWVMHSDGTHLRRLTKPTLRAFYPDWSPDGRHILFGDNCCLPNTNLWVVRPNGRGMRQITHVDGHHNMAFARYSPDGRRIVLMSDLAHQHSDGTDIYVMKADGGGLRRLTTHPPSAFFSDWGAEVRS
jgi:TolB protein